MLHDSDNVIAECLARQVALAEHQPASFTGRRRRDPRGAAPRLGVDPGAGMVDASGLAAARPGQRRPTLARRAAAGRRPPHPRAARGARRGLPVAGWSGTLRRPLPDRRRASRGRARAGQDRHPDRRHRAGRAGPRPRRAAARVRAHRRPDASARGRRPLDASPSARRLRLLDALPALPPCACSRPQPAAGAPCRRRRERVAMTSLIDWDVAARAAKRFSPASPARVAPRGRRRRRRALPRDAPRPPTTSPS